MIQPMSAIASAIDHAKMNVSKFEHDYKLQTQVKLSQEEFSRSIQTDHLNAVKDEITPWVKQTKEV